MLIENFVAAFFIGVFFVSIFVMKKTSEIKIIIARTNQSRNIGALFFVLLITVIFGFRTIDETYGGSDTLSYISQFLYGAGVSKVKLEPLYVLYINLLRRLTANWRVFIILNTLFMAATFVYFLDYFTKNRKNFKVYLIFWPVLIYLISNAVRNGLAVGFCLIAIVEMQKKNQKNVVILTFIATLFHYSAVCMLVYEIYSLLFTWLRKKRISVRFIILVSICILALSAPIIQKIFLNTRYAFLAGKTSYSIIGALPYYIIAFLAYKFRSRIITTYDHENLLYGTFFFCIIYPVLVWLGAYRLPYYFLPILCIIASDIIDCLNLSIFKQSRKFVNFAIWLVFISYGYLRILSIGIQSGILMYKLF